MTRRQTRDHNEFKDRVVDMNVVGSFWPAARPDKRVAGRLTFDARDGAALELGGSFHDPGAVLDKAQGVAVGLEELFGFDSPPLRILGDTSDGQLTLDRCVETSSSYSSTATRQSYYVPLVFHGAHFHENDPLSFDAVRFHIRHLAHWVGKSSLQVALDHKQNAPGVEQMRITHTPLKESVAHTEFGRLTLAFEYKYGGDHIVDFGIEQHCSLELRFQESESLAEIFRVHGALQDLITIGVAAPAPVTSVRLSHAGTKQPIQLRAQMNVTDVSDDNTHPIDRWKMLFTCDAIGGLEGIGRWLTVSKKFRPVLGALTSRWYKPEMYDDTQFFYMVTAAETFERIRRQKQSFNFKEALTTLASDVGTPFQALVGDVEAWAAQVVRTRDNHIVHCGLHHNLDEELTLWLTESIYILVVLCLLRECGLSESVLPNDQNYRWMRRLAGKLQKSS